MVVATAKDTRVLMVKLADRLHNMRTLELLPPGAAGANARETLEIYAPLAHRLGMNTVKWELEDLSFRHPFPQALQGDSAIGGGAQAAARQIYYARSATVSGNDSAQREDRGAKVTGRPKHRYSIYQKMIVRGRDVQRDLRPRGRADPGRHRAGTATRRSV